MLVQQLSHINLACLFFFQLFTEYGRLAMEEFADKPFQVLCWMCYLLLSVLWLFALLFTEFSSYTINTVSWVNSWQPNSYRIVIPTLSQSMMWLIICIYIIVGMAVMFLRQLLLMYILHFELWLMAWLEYVLEFMYFHSSARPPFNSLAQVEFYSLFIWQ